MGRRFYIAGSIFGLIGIILGAFAAHGLKPLLSAEEITSFETGVRFQMFHALLFLILGLIFNQQERKFSLIFYLLLFGVILFSGSIFLLATNSLSGFDFSVIALVTPLGGTMLIICWFLLAIHFIKLKKE